MNKIIWRLFYVLIGLIAGEIVLSFLGIKLMNYLWFEIAFLGIPAILLVLHSIVTLTFFRSIILIILAGGTGFIFEYFGLKYGTVFGGQYIYNPDTLKILTVPVAVILYWGVFIYTGYTIVNSFLTWTNNRVNLKLLPLIILADGLTVVAIDLFMDPLQVKQGAWRWMSSGPYFGIPTGNFTGWFVVTIIVTGIFRLIQYFRPIKRSYDKKILIIPVIGYGILAVSFALTAIQYQMWLLTIIGSVIMLPTVLANIILFRKYLGD
jgi:bisanhydrobacterioruberin hydratase